MKRCFFVTCCSLLVFRYSFIVAAWLFLLLLSSCASKQQSAQRREHFESSETQQTALSESRQAQNYQHWYSDSTALAEQLLIYPEGSIQIGPAGFVGNAKAVLWLRQQKQQSEATSSLAVTEETLQSQEDKAHIVLSESEKASSSKTTGFTGMRWGVFGLVVLIGLCYWFWRRR